MTALATELARSVDLACAHIEQALPDAAAVADWLRLRADPTQHVETVLRGSDFVAAWAATHADIFVAALAARTLALPPDRTTLARAVADEVARATDDDAFASALREFRDRIQVGIIYRLLAAIDDFTATVTACTTLAEVAVSTALDWLYPRHCETLGEPRGQHSGQRQELIVLALGKLGACELNLSSDIDLMFVWPESGQTTRGHDNQVFMLRLVQRLIGLVGGRKQTRGAFRVDVRLRPFGNAGALAVPFDALEEYLAEHGREWERFAFLRARPITGSASAQQTLSTLLERFVYRRYVDYGAIEALREMKQRIMRERGTASDDVKVGAGGIREVEFVVQSMQLIYGGRDRRLRTPRTREAMSALSGKALDASTAEALDAAYVFLRNVEHHLQALRDEQTQRLPRSALDQHRLAIAFGAPDFGSFRQSLDAVRALVGRHFAAAVRDSDDAAAADASTLWPPATNDTPAALSAIGFRDAEAAFALLEQLMRARDGLSERGEARARLDRFVPRLLRAAAATDDADRALRGTLPVIEAVLRRSVYLALLNENATALAELVTLCRLSPVIAEELALHPSLLDDLIDPREWRQEVTRSRFDREVAERLARVSETDFEARMDALRTYKRSQFLAIAAAALRGRLPLMRVSDAFTWLAEALVLTALTVAQRATATATATTAATAATAAAAAAAVDVDATPILVVAYGKLGGLELAPRSDLDLVLLHEATADAALAGGQRQHRTLQRFVHVLTTMTREGRLYEIDMRLRPSGRDGLPLVAMSEFERYESEDAWTFEHQALLRARAIRIEGDGGNAALAERFESIRTQILTRPREPQSLRAEIAAMRTRMRDQRKKPPANDLRSDLKYGRGGIVDVEFVVQYLALAGASRFPELVAFSDNVRILEAIARVGMLPVADAQALRDAYLVLREARHCLDLGAPVNADALVVPRARVAAIYTQVLGI